MFDIVINGGGIIGLVLACGLQEIGLSVAVIERREPTLSFCNQSTLRVSAINVASRRLLQYVQVWESLVMKKANPYQGIEVWERDSFGKVVFDGIELGHPQLGYIIENSIIHKALWQHVSHMENVTLFFPAVPHQVIWGGEEVSIILDNDERLTAQLIVATDEAAHSWLRQYADIPLIFWDYQHHALVATIRTELPHGNIVRQVFHEDGILAFLPLMNPYLSSIIWSLPPGVAQQYLRRSVDDFNIELATCFDLKLGLCELQDERQIFPLTARYARNFAVHRLVLIGDAAHTVHPLSGQGVNLGFMDVAMLLGELRHLKKYGKDAGRYSHLQRYEHNRKYNSALMLAQIQGFHELCYGCHPIKKWIRVTGLWLTNILPDVKLFYVKQMIGLKDLPIWMEEESVINVEHHDSLI